MTAQTPRINQVRIVGTLDTQTISRRDAATLPGVIPAAGRGERPRATVTRRFNAAQGSEQRVVLQVASPFGTPFQITLHLEASVAGCDLLERSPPGTILAVTGELEWVQITDPRYVVDMDDRGRRSSELIVRARTIEGMLERYLVPLRGAEVDRAVAALDVGWQREQAQRDAERRYARQRRRLQETMRTRVAGAGHG